ncbi:MAG: Ig-like domain-containing protein [Lachnospiraceae bacterium]|nr:Ig-like domain-containing protein [Lachnospiraceae bacterium]
MKRKWNNVLSWLLTAVMVLTSFEGFSIPVIAADEAVGDATVSSVSVAKITATGFDAVEGKNGSTSANALEVTVSEGDAKTLTFTSSASVTLSDNTVSNDKIVDWTLEELGEKGDAAIGFGTKIEDNTLTVSSSSAISGNASFKLTASYNEAEKSAEEVIYFNITVNPKAEEEIVPQPYTVTVSTSSIAKEGANDGSAADKALVKSVAVDETFALEFTAKTVSGDETEVEFSDYEWTVVGALPASVTTSGNKTAKFTVSGAVAASSNYAFEVKAAYSETETGSIFVKLVVGDGGEVIVDPVDDIYPGLDPIPANLDSCTELFLVKGQKVTLSANWTLVNKKQDKSFVSVTKKGVLTAKKATTAPVTISHNSGRQISVSICAPTIDKKAKVEAGATAQIKLSGYDTEHMAPYWYSEKPDVATVDQDGKITGVSKGSVKVIAYINGKAYTCKVKVTETGVSTNRTLHMNLGSSKTLSLKGIKAWESADDTIATTKNKKGKLTKKISTVSAGEVVLTASANGVEYTVNLTVEDITLKTEETEGKLKAARGKNKYTAELTVGDELILDFASVEQDLVFKSNKPAVAFANEDRVIVARAAGKATITTKINGKTVKITVNVKAAP